MKHTLTPISRRLYRKRYSSVVFPTPGLPSTTHLAHPQEISHGSRSQKSNWVKM
jgi:hypothetical protein